MKLKDELQRLGNKVEQQIEPILKQIERTIDLNQWKVLEAFRMHKVSDYHFSGSSGYGYNDRGREVLDQVYADIFGAEAAVVRPHFASGTHTIATALFGVLRPGDHLLFITGSPYDTLHKVIGREGDGKGTLRDWGIEVDTVPLDNGSVNWREVRRQIKANTKVIGIQRSRGYTWRPSFSVAEIGQMVSRVKEMKPDVIIFADNCYGEFTETVEPTQVGVDLIAGSLIKNPGGGLALSGGYIAGKKQYVELAAYRMTAPGIGGEVGATGGALRSLFQGLFLAPHVVGQALKGAVFAAAIFEQMGLETHPRWNDPRSDIIQSVRFRTREQLIRFVQGIQYASPVDSHVTCEPWDMPGYDSPVIMAAGTFVQGGSVELSADAPVREPFIAYMQGGLTYSHVKMAVLFTIQCMIEQHLL